MKKLIAFAIVAILSITMAGTSFAGSLLDQLKDLVTETVGDAITDALGEDADVVAGLGDVIIAAQQEDAPGVMDAYGEMFDAMDENTADGEGSELGDWARAYGDLIEAAENDDTAGMMDAYGDALDATQRLNERISASDLPGMSSDDLIALAAAVQQELEARGILKDYIGAGTYAVGTDIRASRFRFTCLQKSEGADSATVSLYAGDELLDTMDMQVKDIIDLNLVEGTTLVIATGSGSMTEVEPSWAP